MSTPGSSDSAGRSSWGLLADDLLALAEVADDDATVDVLLTRIALTAAEALAGVDYASITAWRGAGFTTVAASSELARAVDDAQHAESAGPCVLAEQTAAPVGVPAIAATMSWPGFYRQATALGLRASVSVPLFAGGGAPVAVLNLYGRDPAPLVALDGAVREVFAVERIPDGGLSGVGDAGTRGFLAGLGLALQRRVAIQRAVGMLMAEYGCDAAQAHQMLRKRAAAGRQSLSTAATRMITQVESGSKAGVQITASPRIDDVVVVTMTGELAAPIDAVIREQLRAVLEEPAAIFEWDLSGLRFCDLAGLRLLLDVRRHTVASGRRVRVVAVSGAVHTLMLLTETAALFDYPAAPGPTEDADPAG